jgi:Protein of unknown function (DUF2510)
MSGLQAGWLADPTGRHEYRWWDGNAWSDVVADQGVEGTDPLVPYATVTQGAPTTPGPQSGRSSRQAYAVLAILAIPLVVLLVVLAVVLGNGDGGGDDAGDGDEQTPTASPREALITSADMPEGWTETEVTFAPSENQVCEPRLEPPEPPREVEAAFDRQQPSGALNHRIRETTPQFASDVLDEAVRQADACGTFTDEFESGGETYRFTGTSEVLTGPTFGDETVWYSIHVEYELPTPSTHDVLICLDRHGGVISGMTLSTAPPTSDSDRAMVENLMHTAAERLQGGGES